MRRLSKDYFYQPGTAAFGLLGVLLLSGCSIDIGEVPFLCNVGGTECPDGYTCRESYGNVFNCVKEGTCPSNIKGCPTVAECGNGRCEPGETSLLCPQDCTSTDSGSKFDGPKQDGGPPPQDQFKPPQDQYVPPPDQYIPPPDQPPPLGQYGDRCSATMKCSYGYDCVPFGGSSTNGYCTAKCSSSGQKCTGTPGSTAAYCIMNYSSNTYCAFLCKLGTTSFPCPTQLKCNLITPNPPGSDQYVCEP